MDYAEYKALVGTIKLGKKLPDAIYLHDSALEQIPSKLSAFLHKTITILKLESSAWNIAKFSKKEFKLSLLHYPDFFTESYPALHHSFTIDLSKYTYRKTNYKSSHNPPILHRKEAFLLPTDPNISEFTNITKEGEKAGLYQNSTRIGFKKNWDSVIQLAGYTLINGRLEKAISSDAIPVSSVENKNEIIERHKTAIDRNSLSSPMQSLFRHNYLNGEYSLFDYGCGKGDDLNILANHNVTAKGWDPVYYPDNKPILSDIVNLGFVLNVIEKPAERQETLKNAYKLVKKVLVASVMLGGESITNKFEKFGDGVITARNTFQKYYSQIEFREYLQETLNETAFAVGPGLFYIFKDKQEEQRFLVARQRIKKNWQKLSYTDHPERLKVKQRALYERHKELFEEFWSQCLAFGRLPANNEFNRSEELRILCSSHQKSFDLLTTIYGHEAYTEAIQARRDDLLVHYALGLFGRRKPYKQMPDRLKRDVKHFLGNYTSALKEATELLFSVGKPELIYSYCEKAYNNLRRGHLQDNHSLTIHRDDVEQLPAPLRVYIGCATQLYGDIDTVDLVKVHIRSGKVSLMCYDDFTGKPLPLLQERIKIKLRDQAIDFFDYGEQFKPQPVYMKSKYLNENYPNYKKQLHFDEQVKSFSWFNLDNYGPSYENFSKMVRDFEELDIQGFQFIKRNSNR